MVGVNLGVMAVSYDDVCWTTPKQPLQVPYLSSVTLAFASACERKRV